MIKKFIYTLCFGLFGLFANVSYADVSIHAAPAPAPAVELEVKPSSILNVNELKSIDPGVVYKNQVREYEEIPDVLKKKEANISGDILPEERAGQVVTDDVTLYLEKVIFEGNTVIKTEELNKLAQYNILDRDTTLTYLGDFIEKITKLYQDKGYLTSFAYLPPQTIKDKTVTIKIFEGKIGDIDIEGNKFSSTNFIKYQLLKPYFVKEGQVLNVNDIRQAMIEMNEKGFISGSIVLEKGQEKGTTDLRLTTKDKQPFRTSVSWDNAGRDLIGRQRFSTFISDNNLTGHGDVLSAAVSLGRHSVSVGPQYMLPVGKRGDKVYASYGYSNIRPTGGQLSGLNYRGNAHIITVGMTNPIYKNHDLAIDLNTSFNIKEGSFSINPFGEKIDLKDSDYGIRTLETGIRMVQKDKLGRTYVNVGANIGLPILGPGNDSHFIVLNGGVVRQFWLSKKGVAILRFNGQLSPDSTIPAIEQFQLGGSQTVRGFNEGTLLGKSGFTAGAQVNLPVPFLPSSLPIWKKGDNIYRLPIRDRIQLIGFYDCGYAASDYDLGAEFLQSVGTGLRIYLTKYLTASVDFGIPVGKVPDGANRFRTHFFVTSNIL